MRTLQFATVGGCPKTKLGLTQQCLARRNATRALAEMAGAMTQQSATVSGTRTGEAHTGENVSPHAITQPYTGVLVGLPLACHVARESSPRFAHARVCPGRIALSTEARWASVRHRSGRQCSMSPPCATILRKRTGRASYSSQSSPLRSRSARLHRFGVDVGVKRVPLIGLGGGATR